MNKKVALVIAVVVVIVLAGGGWLLVSNHNKKNTNNMSNMNMSSNGHSSSNNQTAQATNTVNIQNFAFSPSAITVKVGATVTWTNKDSVAHTVTETDSMDGPKSGNVNPNASYSFTFKTPGTYHYNCSIHPEMVGTVIVTAS